MNLSHIEVGLYKLCKLNFAGTPSPVSLQYSSSYLLYSTGVYGHSQTVVTVGPPRSGLVKPIYRNISYSQLGISQRPENINLATKQTAATLRGYKFYQQKTQLFKMSWVD